jgi:hypothetical protein
VRRPPAAGYRCSPPPRCCARPAAPPDVLAQPRGCRRSQPAIICRTSCGRDPLLPGNIPFSPLPGPRTAEGAAGSSFSCGEHTGTHLDAPANFGKGLPAVDEITPVRLMSQGVMIDVRARAAPNPEYMLTLADLQA